MRQTESSNEAFPGYFLAHFGVYHPRKARKLRVVFDAAVPCHGNSLNDLLMKGPTAYNSLLGVLMRFRKEKVGVTCDVEQFFHSFLVTPAHRSYLRFLWYQENDEDKPIVEHRMRVHLFENTSSPGVCMYGIKRAILSEVDSTSTEAKFIERSMFVDDGIHSSPNAEQASTLIRNVKATLAKNKIRLHKIASNSPEVMRVFPCEDLIEEVQNFETADKLPTQSSLGLKWDIKENKFLF